MASSSSSSQARSIVSPKLYDVFISHRGPDVKETLAKQLYDLVKARQCEAFLDREEIEGGDSITAAIHQAICSSRVQVAIFSKGYAESMWCLEELVHMLKQQPHALFIPVFYDVKPWELRHIDDKKNRKIKKNESQYAAAFFKYRSKGRDLDKLEEWKKALASAADISGYELGQHQGNLCEKIVSRVVQAVEKSIPLHVAIYPVGLDDLVQDFERCCSNTAGMVGIYGLGGAGKTTLARELFNRKCSSYTASCFLSDVRESRARRDLHSLQKQLFKDLLRKDQEINNVDDGIGKLKYHLGRAKDSNFLIVLDDIDDQDQIHALLPRDTPGSGSLVIITTRDRGLLRDVGVLYEMRKMGKTHAKELFCSHAFHERDPPSTYEELVESFVEYCGGLPLSLMVLGAHVYRRDRHYWELELEKARKIPQKNIMQRLKISFDSLDREEKQIFIDIACLFYKKKQRDLISNAIKIWKASGWNAEHALQTLKDKCLLEVVVDWSNRCEFAMHDHLRDLGRVMADELGPPRLWKPDILKSMEEKGFRKILAETKGRSFHRIVVESSTGREITYFIADSDLLWLHIGAKKYENTNLVKFLSWIPRLKLHNRGSVNSLRLPPWIPLLKLHILNVYQVKEFWRSFRQQLQANNQATLELRKLRIWDCSLKPPYWSMEMLNHLEELEIVDSPADTTSLVQSLQHLSNLRSLVLYCSFERKGRAILDSINLDSSTRCSCLKRLETIQLDGLQTISNLVISGEMCPKLRSLYVKWLKYLNQIELKQLESLNALTLDFCPKLETVSGLSSLTGLRQLEVCRCEGLRSLPSLEHLRRLEQIKIAGCSQLQSVEGIEELPGLENLVIQMSDDRYASGLRMPLVKRTILTQKAMPGASAKLTANLFSEVFGDAAVSEIETGKYEPTIESSPSAITIYTLLVEPVLFNRFELTFEREIFCYVSRDTENLLITFLLKQYDSKDMLRGVTAGREEVRVIKGFKAIVKVEEESKALIVLQRIVDRLYTH